MSKEAKAGTGTNEARTATGTDEASAGMTTNVSDEAKVGTEAARPEAEETGTKSRN